MAISGFPNVIDLTLGNYWSGRNGLGFFTTVQLQRITGFDYWSEDGTFNFNSSTNRLLIQPFNNGSQDGMSFSAASFFNSGFTQTAIAYGPTGGTGTYNFYDIYNTPTSQQSVAFFGIPGFSPTYNLTSTPFVFPDLVSAITTGSIPSQNITMPSADIGMEAVEPDVIAPTVPNASLTLEAIAPNVLNPQIIVVPVAELSMEAEEPGVIFDQSLSPGAAELTLETEEPNNSRIQEVGAVALTMESVAPEITNSFAIDGAAELTMEAVAPDIGAPLSAAQLDMEAVAPDVINDQVITMPSADIGMEAEAPTVYACTVIQIIESYDYNLYDLNWKDDCVLDKPILDEPVESEVICGEVTATWFPVIDADFFVLQWCRNTTFTGPTLRAVRVEVSTVFNPMTGLNEYTFVQPDEIGMGDSVSWRIIAFSDDGCVSEKSDPRLFNLNCVAPQGQLDDDEENPSSCEEIGVDLEIIGLDSISCKDMLTLRAKLIYNRKNEDGDVQATFISDTDPWSLELVGGANIDIDSQTDAQVVIESDLDEDADDTQEFTVKYTAQFVLGDDPDDPDAQIISCTATFQVKVNCDSPAEMWWGKITAEAGTGEYTVKRLGKGLADASPAQSEQATEVQEIEKIPLDTIVRVFLTSVTDLGQETETREYNFDVYVVSDAVGGNTIGEEGGGETALSDSWDQTDGDGVTLIKQYRTIYNSSGDEVLYAYYRDEDFDALGHLKTVSVETRVTINAPDDDCT